MAGLPPGLREAIMTGDTVFSPAQDNSAVADLLVSQTETADVVILNKVDLIDKEELETIDQIVVALNPKARVDRTSFGNVPFSKGHSRVASHHSHDHDHGHHSEHTDCGEHAQQDNQAHSSGASLGGADCAALGCTDPSHSHGHSHSHSDATTLHQLGIGSFVYRARKPFHPQRLTAFLRHLSISRGLPEKTNEEPVLSISHETKEALQRVVRSKGFVWTADSNVAANYWSHAGSSFELPCLGRWWATLPRREVSIQPAGLILLDDFL
jgi:G3E family GTPase